MLYIEWKFKKQQYRKQGEIFHYREIHDSFSRKKYANVFFATHLHEALKHILQTHHEVTLVRPYLDPIIKTIIYAK